MGAAQAGVAEYYPDYSADDGLVAFNRVENVASAEGDIYARTEGDDDHSRPIQAGDRGVFVRRIEQALSDGEIDLAVHSLKDLPTVQPEGLTLAAIPRRHDPRDALLTVEPAGVSWLAPKLTQSPLPSSSR